MAGTIIMSTTNVLIINLVEWANVLPLKGNEILTIWYSELHADGSVILEKFKDDHPAVDILFDDTDWDENGLYTGDKAEDEDDILTVIYTTEK